MKVLLIKDVYNLGRAGEVKKVADGYARNFLLPKKMAIPAKTGALKQIEKIRDAAAKQRELLNEEMSGLAEQISGLALTFTANVGETGKLYGSITQQMIIDKVNESLKVNLDRHQIESQPLRGVGEHSVRVRLTFDLVPEVKVTVEGEEEEETPEEQGEAAGRKLRTAKIEEIVEAEESEAEESEAEESEAEESEAEESEAVEAEVLVEKTDEESSEPEEQESEAE